MNSQSYTDMQGRCLSIAAVFALCIFTAGCASKPVHDAPTRYSANGPCAERPAVLTARSIPSPDKDGKPATFVLDATTPCLGDGQAKRLPALLFSLANVALPAEIQIVTSGRGQATFVPRIRLLDTEFVEQTQHSFNQFSKHGMDFSISIFLNQAGSHSEYLLVVPDEDWLGKENLNVAGKSQTTYISTGVVMAHFTHGYEEKETSMFSDVGSFSIQAKAYAPFQIEKRR